MPSDVATPTSLHSNTTETCQVLSPLIVQSEQRVIVRICPLACAEPAAPRPDGWLCSSEQSGHGSLDGLSPFQRHATRRNGELKAPHADAGTSEGSHGVG